LRHWAGRRGILAPVALAALGVLLTILVTVPGGAVPGLPSSARAQIVGGAWLAFAAALLVVRRVPQGVAVRLILIGAVAMPLAATLVPPTDNDDVYRYVWDGRVQAAGVDSYQYPPAAKALVGLRDPALWPPNGRWCVPPGELAAGCTLINRPTALTSYPPGAQVYFRLVHAISPAGALARPFQLAGALLAIATTLVLLRSAKAREADPRSVITWAWCPAVALEAANNAHVDALAVLLTALALLGLHHRGKDRWLAGSGALLGLAVATRLTPLLVMPVFVRRRPAIVALTVPLVVAALYLPHVLRLGRGVLGHLPGSLAEAGYPDGFALLTLFVPAAFAAVVAAAALVAVTFWVSRRAQVERPWPGAALMVGAALLLTTPGYPWSGLLLVVLVALGARTVWLTVVAAAYLVAFAVPLHANPVVLARVGYGLALAAVAGTVLVTRHWSHAKRPAAPAPAEPEPGGPSGGSGDPAST
jgi:hypothetical protein